MLLLVCSKFMERLITGYLPSVVLMLFLYAVPPTMMMFSTFEGPISRSGRKKSACFKVLYFLIWNVFLVNVSSAKFIERLDTVSSAKDMTAQLATAVPGQVLVFFLVVFPFVAYGCSWLSPWFIRVYNKSCFFADPHFSGIVLVVYISSVVPKKHATDTGLK